MSLFMRAWGMAFAVPIGGIIFLTRFGHELQHIGLESDIVNSAKGYLLLMDRVIMNDEEREAVKVASACALQVVWEVVAAVSAMGGISSMFLWKQN